MKQKTWIVLILSALLALTACAAIVHLTTRQTDPQGTIRVIFGDQMAVVRVEELNCVPVTGELVNGKGERTQLEAEGILLSEALASAEIRTETVSRVVVTAADGFSAEISGDELREDGKVWLTVKEDTATMVVFGDENAKRRVKDVVTVEVLP